MKVAFINLTPDGTTGRIMTKTAEALTKKGHSCVIFYGIGEASESNFVQKIKIEKDFNINCHKVKAKFFGKNGYGSNGPTRKLIRYLKDFDPDVIQLYKINGYYLNVYKLFDYLRYSRANIFWRIEDCWPFTGGCSYFTECEKWKIQCRHCKYKNKCEKSFIDNTTKEYKKKKECFSYMPNMQLITPSDWMKDIVAESFLKDYDCMTIKTGVDVKKFSKRNNEIYEEFISTMPKKYILGIATVWDERTRIDVFIQIAEKLEKLGISAVMIGKVDKKYDMNKYQNIMYFEEAENSDFLAEMYRNALCVINCSKNEDFTTIGPEAMACGAPLVLPNVGGTVELVVSEPVTGLLAIPDDPDDFVSQICKIRLEQDKYKKNSLIKAQSYSEKTMCDEYLKLYVSSGINDQSSLKRKSKFGKKILNFFAGIMEVAVSAALIVFLVTLITTFCKRNNEVVGNSMLPNYTDGETVKSSGLKYLFSEPKIGDVVIIDSELDEPSTFFTQLRDGFKGNFFGKLLNMSDDTTYYLKRVVGVPGDKIEFINEKFYRNGQAVEEDYLYEDNIYSYPLSYSYIVPDGYVFVMGDNRNISEDSRTLGPIPFSHIVGKVNEN